MRYNLMGNAGHWFPGTNAAKFDAGAIQLACRRSPSAERIPGILAEAHSLLHGAQQKRLSQSD
jgi:predicted aldo/keto reductase-like oxidoreductase